MHVCTGRPDCAQDGCGADMHAREFPELLGGSKRHARNPQGAAELPRHKRLVVRGDVEVKLRLLAVAQEDGLHDIHANTCADVRAVLHGDTRVGVHALEGNSNRFKRLVNKLLKWRIESIRRGVNQGTYVKIIHRWVKIFPV